MIAMFTFLFLTVQAPGAPVIELDRLAALVLERNRDVLVARRAWEAAQTRPSQQSTLPNPTISLSAVNSGILPLPGRSIGMEPQSYISPMVMQEVPFPGKLRLQGEIAQKESGSLAKLYEAAKLKAVNELKQAYFGLYQAEKALATVEKNKQLLDQLAEIARVRYEVGSGLLQDVLKAQLEATLLEERLTTYSDRLLFNALGQVRPGRHKQKRHDNRPQKRVNQDQIIRHQPQRHKDTKGHSVFVSLGLMTESRQHKRRTALLITSQTGKWLFLSSGSI